MSECLCVCVCVNESVCVCVSESVWREYVYVCVERVCVCV